MRIVAMAGILWSLVAAVAAAQEPTFVIPVVGSAPGNFGSFFRTGVQVLNTGGAAVSGRFIYHPAGVIGASTDPSLDFSIPGGATISYADLVQTMGQTGLGSLDVVVLTPGGRIALVTRVFNDAGVAGTSGFTEEALGVCASTTCAPSSSRFIRQAGPSYLIAPANPSRFRFNLGVRTLETGATVSFGVYNASGGLVRSITKAYSPNYFIQQAADIFLGVPLLANYSVAVGTNSGLAVVYGATLDNTTNDSSIQSTGLTGVIPAPVCDAVCLIQNGASASAQTTYWQFSSGGGPLALNGLGCGGQSGCFAKVALFADGTGKIAWGGSQSRICPSGTNLVATDFSWVQTGPSTILFTGATGGVQFRCSSGEGFQTMSSMSNIHGGAATATMIVYISFGGPVSRFEGSLIYGIF